MSQHREGAAQRNAQTEVELRQSTPCESTYQGRNPCDTQVSGQDWHVGNFKRAQLHLNKISQLTLDDSEGEWKWKTSASFPTGSILEIRLRKRCPQSTATWANMGREKELQGFALLGYGPCHPSPEWFWRVWACPSLVGVISSQMKLLIFSSPL